jgi:cytochrome c biogenesis protein CcmG/thiol:disulfide interchange protein DsbE
MPQPDVAGGAPHHGNRVRSRGFEGIVDRRALALLVALFVMAPGTGEARTQSTVAPPFTLPTAAGSVSLDSLQAKVVLVDFWASWCGPCKKSFPWMSTMQERYGSKGLAIVAINVDKSRDAAEKFLTEHPTPFVVAYDPSGKTAKAFHVWGMPTSFLVGPGRAILASRSGFDPKHAKEVEAMIQEACAR